MVFLIIKINSFLALDVDETKLLKKSKETTKYLFLNKNVIQLLEVRPLILSIFQNFKRKGGSLY